MKRFSILCLLLGLAAASGGTAGATGAHRTAEDAARFIGGGPAVVDDGTYDCLEPVPERVGVRSITDDGQVVRLDALVLLDGIGRSRAVQVMGTASRAYRPLGIALRSTFRPVRFRNSGEYHEMERAALRAVGGQRPPGFDVVYVMTAKDLHSMGNYDLGGFAFCIGGVRDPKVAFAIGEGNSPWESIIDDDLASGKIAGHEIGHLLGAHHHYANCAEGDTGIRGGGRCTLMWTIDLRLVGLNFGTLEASVIRGHAVEWASP